MNDIFDTTFAPRFTVTFGNEPMCSVVEYAYPGATEGGFVQGISFEIIPENRNPWFASFAQGVISPNAVSAVIAMPDKTNALVISKGEAYIVDTNDPMQWTHLQFLPVMGWQVVIKYDLVLLWNFSCVLALGSGGVLWKTPSISWDGLKLMMLDDREAIFEVWNAPTDSKELVRINLETGAMLGVAGDLDVRV